MLENSARVKWVDQIKGIAIALVVLGHACTPSLCDKSICAKFIYFIVNSIHMPIFFYLSGYFYKKKDNTGEYIAKKAKKLLLPYFVYSVLVYLFLFVLFQIPFTESILMQIGYSSTGIKDAIKGILLCNSNVDKHLWFIYALFFIYILRIISGALSERLGEKGRIIENVLVCAALILGTFRIWENAIFCSICYYYPFFVFGERKTLDSYHKKDTFLLIGAIILYAFTYFDIVTLPLNDIYEAVMRLIIAVCSIKHFLIIKDIDIKPRAKKVLCYLGANSFWIYLLHQPFITSGTATILSKCGIHPLFAVLAAWIIGVCAALCLMKVFLWLIGRCNYERINR